MTTSCLSRARRVAIIRGDPMLRFLTAGESHGPLLTAILEGMPAGLPLADGLAEEARVFAEHIATLTPDKVALNRAAVQDRGRALARPDGG